MQDTAAVIHIRLLTSQAKERQVNGSTTQRSLRSSSNQGVQEGDYEKEDFFKGCYMDSRSYMGFISVLLGFGYMDSSCPVSNKRFLAVPDGYCQRSDLYRAGREVRWQFQYR